MYHNNPNSSRRPTNPYEIVVTYLRFSENLPPVSTEQLAHLNENVVVDNVNFKFDDVELGFDFSHWVIGIFVALANPAVQTMGCGGIYNQFMAQHPQRRLEYFVAARNEVATLAYDFFVVKKKHPLLDRVEWMNSLRGVLSDLLLSLGVTGPQWWGGEYTRFYHPELLVAGFGNQYNQAPQQQPLQGYEMPQLNPMPLTAQYRNSQGETRAPTPLTPPGNLVWNNSFRNGLIDLGYLSVNNTSVRVSKEDPNTHPTEEIIRALNSTNNWYLNADDFYQETHRSCLALAPHDQVRGKYIGTLSIPFVESRPNENTQPAQQDQCVVDLNALSTSNPVMVTDDYAVLSWAVIEAINRGYGWFLQPKDFKWETFDTQAGHCVLEPVVPPPSGTTYLGDGLKVWFSVSEEE